MQLKKVGRGLLWEAYLSERECFARGKERGVKRKDRSWKMELNIRVLRVVKTNAGYPTV